MTPAALYRLLADWRVRLFAMLPVLPDDYLAAILSVLRVAVGEVEGEQMRRKEQ